MEIVDCVVHVALVVDDVHVVVIIDVVVRPEMNDENMEYNSVLSSTCCRGCCLDYCGAAR